MSRKKASNSGGGKFKRLLGWTVLMAIVFSAGLITGERLVRKEALGPLVSVTDQVTRPPGDAEGTKDAEEAKEETTFAFFDQLTRKDVALSSQRKSSKSKPDDKPAKKPAKQEANKPEPKEEPKKAPAAPEEKTAPAEKAEPVAPAPEESAPEESAPEESAPEEHAGAQARSSEEVAARYTLQVAAHPDMDSAKAHMARLRKMGLEPHVISAAIPGKGKFYRVRVGKFGSMDEARTFQANLKQENSLSTFVSPL